MGLFSDFFLAAPQEVQTCSAEEFDYERFVNHFAVLESKNVDPVTLNSLERILIGPNFSQLKERPYALARNLGEDGPWIYPVVSGFVEVLATLSADQLADVAKDWASTEELCRADPESIAKFLAELSDFVRQPRLNGEQLYVRYQL